MDMTARATASGPGRRTGSVPVHRSASARRPAAAVSPSPSVGGSPEGSAVRQKRSRAPSEYTSSGGPAGPQRRGSLKPSLPHPASARSPRTTAHPRSAIRGRASASNRTFPGERSPWTSPRRWRSARARARGTITELAWAAESTPRPVTRSRRLPPSARSMTRARRPSGQSTTRRIRTTCGWSIRRRTAISRASLSRPVSSPEPSPPGGGGRWSFTATLPPATASPASHTSPCPPSPSLRTRTSPGTLGDGRPRPAPRASLIPSTPTRVPRGGLRPSPSSTGGGSVRT
jgi:hypothetical protein